MVIGNSNDRECGSPRSYKAVPKLLSNIYRKEKLTHRLAVRPDELPQLFQANEGVFFDAADVTILSIGEAWQLTLIPSALNEIKMRASHGGTRFVR